MSELLKSRHAFGSEANIDAALESGLIDAYDILFLKEGKIGWIDADGNKIILEDKSQIVTVDQLPDEGETDTLYNYQNTMYFWDGEGYQSLSDGTGITADEVDAKINTAIQGATAEVNAYTDDKVNDATTSANQYTDEQIANAISIVTF